MTDLRSLLDAIQDEPDRALDLLRASPSLAVEKWSGGKPFIDGSTALHWAAHEDRVDLVHALLDAGADVDVASDDWWVTAVTWAADYGAHGAVRALCDRGANLGGDRWSNATALHAAAQGGSTNGRRDPVAYRTTVEVLVERGCELDAIVQWGGQGPRTTALEEALRVGNVPAAEAIRRAGGCFADGSAASHERWNKAYEAFRTG